MEEKEEKIIYLKPGKYCTLDGDYYLNRIGREVSIFYFLRQVDSYLRNRSSVLYKDDEKYTVRIKRETYGLKFKDIDSYYNESYNLSLKEELNKLYEKYKHIKYEEGKADDIPSETITEEVKNLNTKLKKNFLMGPLHLLRASILPVSIIAFIFGFITTNATIVEPSFFTLLITFIDLIFCNEFKDTGLFSNVPKTIHKIEDNLNELKVRKKELERRDIIHKIEELNKENDNSLNIDTKKEEMKKELLSNLRKLMTKERYEEIVEQISRKKKEEITLREKDYSIESDPYEQVNNPQYAYPSGANNQVMKKVLRR